MLSRPISNRRPWPGEGGPDTTDDTWTAQLDESYAASDQQTAEEDATTAASYADDTTGNPDTDAADAQLYGDAATGEEQTADAAPNRASTAIRSASRWIRQRITDDAPVDDTPVDDTPVDDTPVDDSTVDDDSSAT